MKSIKQALPWTIRIGVSTLFLLSAVAKLYPTPYFALTTFEVKQLKGFEGKKIKIVTKHEIDKSFLIYHMENFRSRNTA